MASPASPGIGSDSPSRISDASVAADTARASGVGLGHGSEVDTVRLLSAPPGGSLADVSGARLCLCLRLRLRWRPVAPSPMAPCRSFTRPYFLPLSPLFLSFSL